jgi:hypothetical protein
MSDTHLVFTRESARTAKKPLVWPIQLAIDLLLLAVVVFAILEKIAK